MKHHINSSVLKDFKALLFKLKDDRNKRDRQRVNVVFKMNDEVDRIEDIVIVNYGCVQTDKNGNIISSSDNSYNFHYRRLAEKDKWEYYHVTLDFRKHPQLRVYVINRDLKLINEDNVFGIKWTSLNGDKKELLIEV